MEEKKIIVEAPDKDYEYTFYVSDKIQEYLDRGDISSWDVKEEIESWMGNVDCTYGLECDTPWGENDSEYTLSELTKEQYEQLEDWDRDDLWDDFESELEEKYGPIIDDAIETQYEEPEDNEETDESLKESNEDVQPVETETKDEKVELKEESKFNVQAFEVAMRSGDVNCFIAPYDGEDFLIVESWEDVAKIQKLLDPSFEPRGKYDTSVIDEFMPWGFSEEYNVCNSCGEVVRTEPDSYSWTPDFFISNDGIYCGDCTRNDPQDYLETLINNPKVVNTILSESDLENAGFEKLDGDYESGWYDRNDSPQEILNDLMNSFPYGEFVFNITSKGQFAVNFDVYGRGMDEEFEEDLKGSKKEVNRELCRGLEDKLYTYLHQNDIYPEDGTFDPSSDKELCDLELFLIIDGDWKHEHLFTEHLVEEFCKKNGLEIVSSSKDEIGNSDSDWYKSQHTWYLKIK